VPRAAAHPEVRARAAELAEQHPEIAEILDKLAEGIPVEGMESLARPLMDGTDSMELLHRLHAAGTHVLLCDPERIRTRAHDLTRTSDEFLEASWAAAAVGGQAPIDVGAAAFKTLADVRAHAAVLHQPWWTVSPFGLAESEAPVSDTPWLETPVVEVAPDLGDAIALHAQPVPLYHGDTAKLAADLRQWAADQWAIALVFEGHGTAQRATELLRDAGLGVTPVDSIPTVIEPGQLLVTCGGLNHGFVDEGSRLAIITGNDITGGRGAVHQGHAQAAQPAAQHHRPAGAQAGDHVVHEQHGIGRYVELVQRTVNGAEREYMVIEYAASKRGQPGDRLFVPTDQLDQLSRYVGGESPTLHKMGGSEWQKSKARARKAVREIAAQLIQLYAARQASKGHAFGPDTPWQRELGGRLPVHRDPRPDGGDHRGQAGHGAGRPDGPADLRRRRLRQDRDRGPGGLQGGPGRQAGRHPGADHAARPAALQHVRRADEPVPGDDQAALPVPDAEGGRPRPWRRRPTAAPTSSSAPTGCSPRRPGSRTSAWSSSTRSSASASSTRSSSRRCAPRSTC
jgi:transcription-repair coupling factor (superfamily II helicase)